MVFAAVLDFNYSNLIIIRHLSNRRLYMKVDTYLLKKVQRHFFVGNFYTKVFELIYQSRTLAIVITRGLRLNMKNGLIFNILILHRNVNWKLEEEDGAREFFWYEREGSKLLN